MKKQVVVLGGGGYIGSRLCQDLHPEYDVTSVDFEDPREGEGMRGILTDYTYMSNIAQYDIVILLAGHSSVGQCKGQPFSAFHNNVHNFIELLQKLKPYQTFIYASSSSVYGNTGGIPVYEDHLRFDPQSHYDITKHVIDLYAPSAPCPYYGLRFGTVNGPAPVTRRDVMINSMVYSAKTKGVVTVSAPHTYRPILGITDLSLAIQAIMRSTEPHPGIYNLASFNSSAYEIAHKVAYTLGVHVDSQELGTSTYSFAMHSHKFSEKFGFKFWDTVESITKDLHEQFDNIEFVTRTAALPYA